MLPRIVFSAVLCVIGSLFIGFTSFIMHDAGHLALEKETVPLAGWKPGAPLFAGFIRNAKEPRTGYWYINRKNDSDTKGYTIVFPSENPSVFEVNGSLLDYRASPESSSLELLLSEVKDESVDYWQVRIDPETHASVEVQRQKLPGTLGFRRWYSGINNYTLYSRKEDPFIFRIWKWGDESSIKGPSKKEYGNARMISGVHLYTSSGSSHHVFVVMYKSNPKSKLFTVTMIVFSLIESTDKWETDTLWEGSFFGLGDDLIAKEDLDRHYFLTSPTIATSSTQQQAVFVFLKSIFTIEYAPKDSKARHQHILTRHRIAGLESFHIDKISLDHNGTRMVVVNKENWAYIFRRSISDTTSSVSFNSDMAIRDDLGTLSVDMFLGDFLSEIPTPLDEYQLNISPSGISPWQFTSKWAKILPNQERVSISDLDFSSGHDIRTLTSDGFIHLLSPDDTADFSAIQILLQNAYVFVGCLIVTTLFAMNELWPVTMHTPIRSSQQLIAILMYIFCITSTIAILLLD